MENADLFETVRALVGCDYISDLKSENYKARALSVIQALNFEDFALSELSDMAEYLCGAKLVFNDVQSARDYFRDACVKCVPLS